MSFNENFNTFMLGQRLRAGLMGVGQPKTPIEQYNYQSFNVAHIVSVNDSAQDVYPAGSIPYEFSNTKTVESSHGNLSTPSLYFNWDGFWLQHTPITYADGRLFNITIYFPHVTHTSPYAGDQFSWSVGIAMGNINYPSNSDGYYDHIKVAADGSITMRDGVGTTDTTSASAIYANDGSVIGVRIEGVIYKYLLYVTLSGLTPLTTTGVSHMVTTTKKFTQGDSSLSIQIY